MNPSSNETTGTPWRAYCILVGWALLIFLTIPLARTIEKFISALFGKVFFGYFVISVILIALGITLFWLKRLSERDLGAASYLWLTGIAGIYIYYTTQLWRSPVEAIHFLEYSVLSYFAFRALRHHVKDHTLYFSALMIVLLVGTLDEVIQWVVPERYWDIRDVWLNFFSGGLFLLAIYKGIRPRDLEFRLTPVSLRILSLLVLFNALLLGLCASNTPARIAHLSSRLSFLSYLAKNPAMMSEYGYKHRDPKIGTFYSRMSRVALKTVDKDQQRDHSQVLNDWKSRRYRDFLSVYTPIASPFLHEMRVHLFRRDRYLTRGHTEKDPIKSKIYTTIAYKENLILETYFGKTLGHTTYLWDESTRHAAKSAGDVSVLYESPVSSNIYTAFSERQLWGAIFGIVIFLAVANLIVGRMEKRA